MRELGTMLSTNVQAERQGPSMTTRSPELRTRSNRSRNGPTWPPGLPRMRTSAWTGDAVSALSTTATNEIPANRARMPEASLILQRQAIAKRSTSFAQFRSAILQGALSVPPRAAQCRQADAGRIEAAVDRQDLAGDIA